MRSNMINSDYLDNSSSEMKEKMLKNEEDKLQTSDKSEEATTVCIDTTCSSLSLYDDFDDVLEHLGNFSRFQQLLYFGLWLPASAMAASAYASIFLEWSPTFACADELINIHSSTGKCYRSDNVTACQEFVYDSSMFVSTLVTEFDLICNREYLQTVSKTVFMLGMLIGSLWFGWLSDKLGRRIAFLVSSGFLAVGSIACAFAFTLETYIVARFVTSCGGMGLFITCFVLALEFVGPRARTTCGVAFQIPFALGQFFMIAIAYFIRDWRLNQTTMAASFLLFPLYLFFIPESVRWLLTRRKSDEAADIVTRVASFNKVDLPNLDITHKSLPEAEVVSSGMSSIFTEPALRLRFLVMAVNWAVTTLGYYGLGLSSANLTSDPFLSFMLSALMEIPGYLSCILTLSWFGRRKILALSQILTGTTCVLAALLPANLEAVKMALSLVGKFGASAAFSILYVYTAEMFHTPARNSAIGLCSTSARIGGLLAPTIASLSATDPLLPFLIMGCCCCAGGCAALLLPETTGHQLPDTVEEAVSIGKKNQTNS